MKVLTKWASCITSFVAGMLALLMSFASGMVVKQTIPGMGTEKSITKAMKVLTDGKLADEAEALGLEGKFMAMKLCSVVLTVVAVLLLVYAVLMLLKNLDKIKLSDKAFSIAGIALVAAFLVATVGVLIASNAYANGVEDVLSTMIASQTGGLGSASVKVGVYQPFMLVIGILAAAVVSIFEIAKLKNK